MRWALSLLLVAWLGGASRPVAADEEAARGHFAAASAYFERGDYAHALESFRAAAREHDVPELDYNIARTCERLGDAACALESYRRYLQRASRISTEDRELVEGRLRDLEPRVGRLLVHTSAADTQLSLDGEPLPPDVQKRPIAVTAGLHRLVARRDGWRAHEVVVTVPSVETATVEIEPLPTVASPPAETASPAPVAAAPVAATPAAPVPAPATPPATTAAPAPVPLVAAAPPPAEPHRSRAWVIGVVVGGVVVAGGAAVAIALAASSGDSPYRGNFPPMLLTVP